MQICGKHLSGGFFLYCKLFLTDEYMRRRSMACIAWRASRGKNVEAFLNEKCN